jgi:uncharacterized phage protein gp47/JayE
MDLPSRLDLFAVGRQYVVERANKIDPKQIDVQGSDVNVFVGSTSVVAFEIVKQLAYSVNRLLLDGAEDEDLDRFAWDRYQTARFGASPAVGTVQFSRVSATVGAGSILVGTKVTTNDGIEYVTTSTAAFSGTDLTSSADVQAVQAGRDFQVGANQIRRIPPQAPANVPFDPTLTVNNPVATAGGADREQDEDFRNRVRDFWLTARRGTLKAIELGARQVPGVVSAQASEVTTVGSTPARVVILYVADGSGVSNQALANRVSTSLGEYRAAGIAVIVVTSQPEIVDVVLRLAFEANVDTVSLTQAVLSAVVGFINSIPVNNPLRIADLQAVLARFRSDGLVVTTDPTTPANSTIVAPVGDVIPDAGKTIRTTSQNVTLAA